MEKLHAPTGTWTARGLITQAMISLVLVLPFVILELINRQNLQTDFPVVLFAFLWLLTFLFILLLIPLARRIKNRNVTSALAVVPKVVLLAVIASIIIALFVDQMPCFLGVPNCD